jgi:hypothetical protein
MVDRQEVLLKTEDPQVTAPTFGRFSVATATVSTGDTVTLGNHTAIDNAVICKLSDGSTVTFTKATNVLTITQVAMTDVPVIIFAYEV